MAVAYYNTGQIWTQWVSTGTTTTTNYTAIWDGWVTSSSTTITGTWSNQTQQYVWNAWEQVEQTQLQRDELQARREQANRERLARQQQQMEDRIVAEARAIELFHELLTNEEFDDLTVNQRISVTGTDGRLYQLETHRDTVHGNIVQVDEHGCRLRRACVAPGMYGDRGALPTEDGWIGQLLGLKYDTEQFLSHANWSNHRRCQHENLREDPEVTQRLQEVA